MSGRRACWAELTAHAEAVSWECVFCVGGTTRRPALPVRRNKGKQEFVNKLIQKASRRVKQVFGSMRLEALGKESTVDKN